MMTIDEKRQRIEEHCRKQDNYPIPCAGCPLWQIPAIQEYSEPCFTTGADIERNYRVLFGDENPYWNRICKLSERQRKKGMDTYGQGLENNAAAMLERINHLEEELVDSLYYLEWIKDKLEEGVSK